MSREIDREAARSELPLWKKALFSLVVGLLFFSLLEIALALVGVRPILYSKDPYVGFSGTVDLFSRHGDDYVTSAAKRDWFNAQRFPVEKADSAFRIFAVGGSTTYGRPYDDRASFAGWLREMLPAADPSRSWETINAGGISYASYRVALLMEKLARYEPDLFLIYTGHNEFLERRTYEGALEVPRIVTRLGGLAARSRLFAVGQHLIEDVTEASRRRAELPAEVDTMLEHSVGPEDYVRDDGQRRLTIEHFRFNLNRMIDIARSADAQVVLIKPESNLRSCSPFKSQHDEGLAPEQLEEFRRLLHEAEQAVEPLAALERLDAAVALDPRHAEARYRRGRALFSLGRFDEARGEFRRAIEEDVCPLRAGEAIRDEVARIASQRDVPLVDLGDRIRSASAGETPGEEVFLDHVHMNAEGYRMVAEAVLESLVRVHIVPAMPSPEALAEASARVRSRIDLQAEGRALRNLAKVFDWAGKHEEAGRLARKAAGILEDDADTFTVRGHAAAWRGDYEEAERHFRKAAGLTRNRAEPLYDWGTALLELGRAEEAVLPLARAAELTPRDTDTLFNSALALQGAGRLEEAAGRLREVLALEPASADAAIALATMMIKAGRPREAALQLEAVARRSDDPRLTFHTGVVLAALGRYAEAVERYREAIRITPDQAQAHRNLGATLLLLGQTDAAIDSLLTALGIESSAETHNHLANALLLAGRQSEAAAHFEEAIRLRPEWHMPRTQWAWFLATHPEQEFRDSASAVRLAEAAVVLTRRSDPQSLDTLAAALAEACRFGEATRTAREALTLLQRQGRPTNDVRERLELYQSGRPYRTP